MKRTLALLIALLISYNCYCQELEVKLQKLLDYYSYSNIIKKDSLFKKMDLDIGTVTVPITFSAKRTGTKDSHRGELTSNNFLINYDIGGMAGAHMNKNIKSETTFYSDTTYSGYRTTVGLREKNRKKELVITIWGDYLNNFRAFPANFWAIVKDENEIKEMLDIVMSYRQN